ncbi:D-alanyl-D-alanine carboxypeptidase-like protein [Saccharopolyspora erythraea NRRL 2338]|uniref:Uncharacterized protein n=1 Tax=Saccharopolyspora erythraea (strain ATCC 11635 / DSM 40517 / JCM 4748 / NBRC 13426 / NCIMB 8594 / NRRL 2338) TaxID=405948 RepID=A4FKJ2_SACEN|nr:M15 family metallopeptidase [Saccharopolyspora erythraea]PFG98205.1 D-alanyl-D-alanine carboxypeptidase-like protein [Saccharopolyspora erythraea NRRL 2338]QRK88305.1 M15 family metallopeptidase [Saccharopolyspora erythraea]CAM04567.1 hypothetical protein SACE_5328 [Saccharopolyspora erythraea NRRL 2338]
MRTRHHPHPARRACLAVALAAVLAQCSSPASPPAGGPPPASPPPTVPARSPFTAEVVPVTAAELGPSWRPGCPVGPAELRRVRLTHVGMDGATHVGELDVHQDRVRQVVDVFGQLYAIGYPVERMRPAGTYPGAEDELSMRDNNTSAFSCRDIPGSGRWSQHALGRAVDVNPLINPYVDDTGAFQPANAAPYLDRARRDPGVLHDGDPAVRAFTDRGWTWGGHWTTPIDYQHFEMP